MDRISCTITVQNNTVGINIENNKGFGSRFLGFGGVGFEVWDLGFEVWGMVFSLARNPPFLAARLS